MKRITRGGIAALRRAFTIFFTLLVGAGLPAASHAAAQTTATIVGGVRLFPAVAAPGEQVWIIGAGQVERGQVWVGGRETTFTRDPDSGWLTFTVPREAAGGPQFIGTQGPATQGPLVLTVLPPEAAAQDVLLYVNPAALDTVQGQFTQRLKRLQVACQKTCPRELIGTLERLAALPFPQVSPLGAKPQGTAGTVGAVNLTMAPMPTQVTGTRATTLQGAAQATTVQAQNSAFQNLTVRDLIRPMNIDVLGAARKTNFCDQLAGVLSTAGLPTGRVLALLGLLFDGDLSVDPFTLGHPDQDKAPFRNEKPRTVLDKFLGAPKGTGKGVTIHVLDTSSPTEDPYVSAQPINYYNEIFTGRPYHGRPAGMIAQTLAPGARLDFMQVCDKTGRCSTLKTVQALCQVATEARRGGKHVVSLSLGGTYPTLGLQLALREVAAAGVPTAASYGNRDDCPGLVPGDRCWHYPADWTGSMLQPGTRNTMLYSVAGWDIGTYQLATYNRGVGNPGILTPPPSVAAPGEFWMGGYPYFGTSFAAPVVAGVLANWMTCKPGVPFLPLVNTPGTLPLPAAAVSACP